jgi:hypothetical protein
LREYDPVCPVLGVVMATTVLVANTLKMEYRLKIMEGGFSYPPTEENRGLENPLNVEEKSIETIL